jgi:N-acetylglutamate synthase-like GNAT family acetyltransferase
MSSPVSIRTASSNDRDGVTNLLKESYPALMCHAYDDSILKAALPLMTVAQPTLLQSGSYYVAETTDGLIVGCGGWTKERPGSSEIRPGLGHIRHFGVHPHWTRRGIGHRIYARCVKDAKSEGVQRLECYSSLNGEAFYLALGFESSGRIEVEMADGIRFPSVHMLAEI